MPQTDYVIDTHTQSYIRFISIVTVSDLRNDRYVDKIY